MINRSKTHDARFWKWKESGAVGSSYLGCRTYNDLVDAGGCTGLKEEQKLALRDSLSPLEGARYYGKHAQTMIDFFKHPKDFVPTDHSLKMAYRDFVVRGFDGGCLPDGRSILFSDELSIDDIDRARMKDVGVKVEYRYSSTLGKKAAVVSIYANVTKNDGESWERMRSGGVAFILSDFIKRK